MATPYVALLRGINVGGNNIIKMDALRTSFEGLGFGAVATLIASGNVVFTAPKGSSRALERKIEKALARDFRYDGKVVVRSLAEYRKMMKAVPPRWGSDAARRYYVLFLREEIDEKAVLKKIGVNPEVEEIRYAAGAVLWDARKDKLTRSKVNRTILQPALYTHMTIRNWNTTQKLFAMLQDA